MRNIIKGKYFPEIKGYRMARFFFGLNCTFQEATSPKTFQVPIPFFNRDIFFIRYNKIVFNDRRGIVERRLDEITYSLEKKYNELGTSTNTKMVIELVLDYLFYVKTGVRR